MKLRGLLLRMKQRLEELLNNVSLQGRRLRGLSKPESQASKKEPGFKQRLLKPKRSESKPRRELNGRWKGHGLPNKRDSKP